MYEAEYSVLVRRGFDSEPLSEKTVLRARFNFKQETAPKEKHIIMGRIRSIEDYLKQQEIQLIKSSGDYYKINYRGKANIILRLQFRPGLGFKLKAVSNSRAELEKVLNLDDLNTFVLAGKLSEKTTVP